MLVRRLCRTSGEDPQRFKDKVRRLRGHFERFNVDVSELCQWLMGLRKRYGNPERRASFGPLGDFLLEPALPGVKADEADRDRWRLAVFDHVAGLRTISELAGHPLPEALRDAMAVVEPPEPDGGNSNARRLFERLGRLQPAHRLVLLKAAAEWIVSRYQRGLENAIRQRELWEREKAEWEAAHPELTESIRQRFTDVFKQLQDPQRDNRPGLRRKNPRICKYERLRQNLDNCCYAGQKGHGPLCWKYAAFVKATKTADPKFNDATFWEKASILAGLCRKYRIQNPGNAFQDARILDNLYAEYQRRKEEKYRQKGKASGRPNPKANHDAKVDFLRLFKAQWNEYLKAMGEGGRPLNGATAVERGELPHCRNIGETWEKSKCRWNPHTMHCLDYKRRLEASLDDSTLALESQYREWRTRFLAAPRAPQFRYPSSRDLPTPKIFGRGFFDVDFDRSILRLRLDDMREGEWIEFGFTPWPRGYSPSRRQIRDLVTSVHINFVGTRARVGFRFDVPHRPSRFACTQDELDELRSRRFPREAQDAEFLQAARRRLLETFEADPERDLRLLAVDLGMTGEHAAVFHGRRMVADEALPIVKINKAYAGVPSRLEKDPRDSQMRGPLEMAKDDPRGLRREHVKRHLDSIAQAAALVATRRQVETDDPMTTLRESDFRRAKRHIRWMIRDWARHNASRIIALAERHRCDLIVFESLRGSRIPDYDRLGADSERQKAERVLYAYGRVRRKVAEKAVERGMRVVTVPYFKSSQVCWKCGCIQEDWKRWKKNKARGLFQCERKDCSVECHSDVNAARLLGRVFWGEITLPESGARRTPAP